jgi:uncharacterized protein (DUF2252 family)
MLLSPFAFLRGSAVIMAQDLAATPVTGIQAQVCGDAHLSNFGIYTTPEHNQVFDVNDFDETLPGPWEWDVKRLAASIIVAGRGNSFSRNSNREAVLRGMQSYREHMWAFAEMRQLHVWYSCLEVEKTLSRFRPVNREYFDQVAEKARRQTKEAQASVLEPHLGPSVYPNHAQRIVNGQHLMQAASDMFLGWTSSGGYDFYIRQLRDRSLSPALPPCVRATSSSMLNFVPGR